MIGHTVLGSQPAGHGPRTATIQSCPDGSPKLDSPFQQLPNLGAAPPPLFPVAHPYPAPNPAVYFRDFAVLFGDAEVAHPSAKVGGQLGQPVLYGDEPASSGIFPDPTAEFLVCLVRPENSGSLEDEAEKRIPQRISVTGRISVTVYFIDIEFAYGIVSPWHA